ncbi:MAG: glycosyltransferase family 2 protein [Candidatus Shapirobacteria bacterium]|nr:glycosyltransferase family 2 protein [Candidatus Shapirobacteria bacterium]
MNKIPLVSIIIVNYNGYHLLKNCLESVLSNTYKNIEIIIADNGSSDQSISKIKSDFRHYLSKKIKIIDLKKNLGPSLARNLAFKHSKGEIIAFLDNDTLVKKNWINKALPFFKNNKIGVIQSKLLLMEQPKNIDYVGEYFSNLGFLKSIAKYGEIDKHQYDKTKYILAAKSAGMFIRRQAFIDAGMFDSDYFIFMEETDLGWRVWLQGYKNILVPNSIVFHKFSSTKNIVDPDFNNYLIRFHGTKNYVQTLIKNLSGLNLLKILPIHVFLWFSLATFLLCTGKFKSAKNIYHGILWNLSHLRQTLKKRTIVQKNRFISDKKLFETYHLLYKTNLRYYVNKFFASQKTVITPETSVK